MQISDPRQIPQSDLPLFVFSDSATDLVSFLITWRTKGIWNHAMSLTTAGKLDVQSWTYSQVKMETYMKKGSRLDFYCLVNATPQTIIWAQAYVYKRLKSHWWVRIYDWVGIFGQAIGIPAIHTPGLEYCSVDVTNLLKNIVCTLPPHDQDVIYAIPDEINPQSLHDYMVAHPEVFKEYAFYESDEGVVV